MCRSFGLLITRETREKKKGEREWRESARVKNKGNKSDADSDFNHLQSRLFV
jgi:hypothetical protein